MPHKWSTPVSVAATVPSTVRHLKYLTIRPVALEGEGSNCFSITQLVGQKKSNNKFSQKKYLFRNKTKQIGLQNRRTSLLDDYH